MLHAREDYQERIQDAAGIIPADEPVFLIRAQDQHSETVLRFYATLVEEAGGDPGLVAKVWLHSKRMATWPTKKAPDCP